MHTMAREISHFMLKLGTKKSLNEQLILQKTHIQYFRYIG